MGVAVSLRAKVNGVNDEVIAGIKQHVASCGRTVCALRVQQSLYITVATAEQSLNSSASVDIINYPVRRLRRVGAARRLSRYRVQRHTGEACIQRPQCKGFRKGTRRST